MHTLRYNSYVFLHACVQRAAIVERLQEMTRAAYLCGVNVLCYQEACSESVSCLAPSVYTCVGP